MTDPDAQPPYEPPAGQPQQPPPAPATPGAPLTAAEDKQWATLVHFLNIIPLIPALIIYLIFKDRGALVRSESKEALNWTINVTGAIIALNIVISIFSFVPILGLIIGILLGLVIWAVVVVNIIFSIMGGVKVNSGGTYRYPLNYRWIK